MSIHPEHLPDLDRFAAYYHAPMLMLGATASSVPEFPTAGSYFARWVGGGYQTLDLDGGDLVLDLNSDIGLSRTHRCVFNLGTLEHVWNAHNAWANALRAVEIGGHFLSHSPISGLLNHGLHMTNPAAIRAFVTKNGFRIVDEWTSQWRRQGEVLWLAARKERHVEDLAAFEPAWQVYEADQKRQVV